MGAASRLRIRVLQVPGLGASFNEPLTDLQVPGLGASLNKPLTDLQVPGLETSPTSPTGSIYPLPNRTSALPALRLDRDHVRALALD